MLTGRVVQKCTKYMISKKSNLQHVRLSMKIHVVGCFDHLRPPGLSTASSCVSYSQGEVGSILGTLEVPYTPEKNYTYQNHILTTSFVTKFFLRHTLLGGPLVKFSKIGTDQYYSP